MMTHRPAKALLFASLILAGCGGGPPNIKPEEATPHGGALSALPDGQGFVEILKQTNPASKKQAELVLYFLDSSKKPMANLPTGVTFKSPANGDKPVAFQPSTDPSRAGALVSAPIPDRGEVDGEITATIDGKSVTFPVNAR